MNKEYLLKALKTVKTVCGKNSVIHCTIFDNCFILQNHAFNLTVFCYDLSLIDNLGLENASVYINEELIKALELDCKTVNIKNKNNYTSYQHDQNYDACKQYLCTIDIKSYNFLYGISDKSNYRYKDIVTVYKNSYISTLSGSVIYEQKIGLNLSDNSDQFFSINDDIIINAEIMKIAQKLKADKIHITYSDLNKLDLNIVFESNDIKILSHQKRIEKSIPLLDNIKPKLNECICDNASLFFNKLLDIPKSNYKNLVIEINEAGLFLLNKTTKETFFNVSFENDISSYYNENSIYINPLLFADMVEYYKKHKKLTFKIVYGSNRFNNNAPLLFKLDNTDNETQIQSIMCRMVL